MSYLVRLLATLLYVGTCVCQTNDRRFAADLQVVVEPELQPRAQRPIPPQLPEVSTPGYPGNAPASDHHRYDPLAKVGDPEKGLKKINPNNVDDGGILATRRIAGVQETIESLYFWLIIFLGGALAITMAYVAWLLHEMGRRRHIAGSIIAQLWNAHVSARGKALDAIEAHNKVMAELNAIDALTTGQKSDSTGETGNAGISTPSGIPLPNAAAPDSAFTVVAIAQDAVAAAAELFERNLDSSQKVSATPAVPLPVKAMQAQRNMEPLPADFGGANSLETLGLPAPSQTQSHH
jgi:hypothetical protein